MKIIFIALTSFFISCKAKQEKVDIIRSGADSIDIFTIDSIIKSDDMQWEITIDSSGINTYFSITDSASGEVAHWEDGKWEILDCEKALTVIVASNQHLNNKINALEKRIYGEPKKLSPDTMYAKN